MSDRFILQFSGILVLLMAAALSVHAQEGMAGSSDAAMNNTTLNASLNLTASNDTIMNATASDMALNETSLENASLISSPPAANVTTPAAAAGPAGNVTNETSILEAGTVEGSQETALAIGGGRQPEKTFVVNGNARPKEPFMVGLPIKSLRDVGKMIFVCDII